jgi:hypothetical protein
VNGNGVVVVEAVLSTPAGAATAMRMCKNYLGPTTVTITRLTDGTTDVAELVNNGTDWVAHDGCENPARFELDRSALIGPTRWPARADDRRLTLAHYYPWYDDADLAGNFAETPVAPADTSDPAEVAAAVAMARGAGIDGFVVEYDGWEENFGRADLVYDAAEASPGFQLALMLDFDNLRNRFTSLDGTVLDIALAEVEKRSSSPAQLEVGGRPVVFLYAATHVDPTAWNAALDRLRIRTGLRPFVVTDSQWLPSPGLYSYSANNLSTLQALLQWAAHTLLQLRAQPGLDGQTGPLWAAPVSPGYDDTRLGRPSPLYVDRRDGARYDDNWQAALRSLPDWVVITSWNEYYEHTHIAPGSATGLRAVEQTAEWTARFRSSP